MLNKLSVFVIKLSIIEIPFFLKVLISFPGDLFILDTRSPGNERPLTFPIFDREASINITYTRFFHVPVPILKLSPF